jgi:hypothetical protein
LVVCVVRGFSSQLALWRLLSQLGLWSYPRFPVSDQAVYKRLAEGGTEAMEHLFAQVCQVLRPVLAPYAQTTLAPFASEVYALDQTALDPVARKLPALRGTGTRDPARLPGKLDGLFDVRRQLWHRLTFSADPVQNEKVLARSLVRDLPAGALILADLGYFGFRWFDDLTDAGYWWLSRLRAKTSYQVVHTYYQDGETLDALIWLGAHRSDRAAHAVRLVQYRRGATLHRYLTNVLDPTVFPLHHLVAVYARRWDIEMAIQLIKEHLGLHLLWSAKPVVIQQQLWAVLIIAQVLQALRLQIAGQAEVDPFEVSLPLVVQYVPELARRGMDPVAFFVARGRAAGFIRPSRRLVHHAPRIPVQSLSPPPPDLVLQHVPRYAEASPGPLRDRKHRRHH